MCPTNYYYYFSRVDQIITNSVSQKRSAIMAFVPDEAKPRPKRTVLFIYLFIYLFISPNLTQPNLTKINQRYHNKLITNIHHSLAIVPLLFA
jgi:hypothetical protein